MNAYKVQRSDRKKLDTVYADYFRIDEQGVVTFRNVNPQQGYPIFVKCYAAGAWLNIENAVTPFRKDTP